MAMLLAIFLTLQDGKFRVEGPPFLIFGETIELRAADVPQDAVVVWRLADAPAGALETTPAMDSSTRVVRGSDRLSIASMGRTEGEIHFVIAAVRKGVRLAGADARVRVGPAIRVRAWCRIVEHPKGGTGRPELFRESEVNRFLRPLGVEVELAPGRPVAAPDSWFDREGRFHPIVLKDGKKANSPALDELLRNDEPSGLNLYFVRDCHWVTVQEGFAKVVTDHKLTGVGLKDGQVVLDDGGDAASLAHEVGHALGLDDLMEKPERGRLMYSIRRDRTGESFTYGEMKDARDRARLHLKAWTARR